MFDYLAITKQRICDVILKVFPDFERQINQNIQNITIEFPEHSHYGDLSTNCAMVLAKTLKAAPIQIANKILPFLQNEFIGQFVKIECTNNGFINFFIEDLYWWDLIGQIRGSENYGSNNYGKNQKINLEFCSANPTGPIHLGHIRGAIWGSTIANILKYCGFVVDKEYYVNDGGGQIETLLQSTLIRYRQLFGYQEEISQGLYPGEYLIGVAQQLRDQFGESLLNNSESENIVLITEVVLQAILTLIKNDLKMLGVEYDVFTRESQIMSSDWPDKMLAKLSEQKLLYSGILEKPKGENDPEWEPREQMLFKSICFGDDMDRAMQRSNGEWTYFAKDCAYHFYKISRNYDWLILEVGIDHVGYKKRLSAAVEALSLPCKQKFSFEFHNMVYLKKNSQQLKISKRSGNLIGAKEIIDEIGLGVLRFYLLSKKHDIELDFDLDQAKEASKNNPYFYVQYACARAHSILRNCPENILSYSDFKYENIEFSQLEKDLLKHLLSWPKTVLHAAVKLEPHKINFYLQELASYFHNWWNCGNLDQSSRIIYEDDCNLSYMRIQLLKMVILVIKNGLLILEIEPLEQM